MGKRLLFIGAGAVGSAFVSAARASAELTSARALATASRTAGGSEASLSRGPRTATETPPYGEHVTHNG